MDMFLIVCIILSVLVSYVFQYKLNKYMHIALQANVSGSEIVVKMLEECGIHGVTLTCSNGYIGDHYNPTNKTINLTPQVYYGRSIAAIAIATHECGHAIQHARGYAFLQLRSAMVPFTSFAARYVMYVILLGIFLMYNYNTLILLKIGIAIFAITTLFSFITLPVEFNASHCALVWIQKSGITTDKEQHLAKDALKWAAMTYVVAAFISLAHLLRYCSFFSSKER